MQGEAVRVGRLVVQRENGVEVLALARAGTLPGEKVGRAWRFVKTDVLNYVRGTRVSESDGSRNG